MNLSPENAGKLLDEVVFERVLSFMDLPGLWQFQQELELALIEVGVDYDEVAQVAKEMVDTALRRLADEDRIIAYPSQFRDCELCDEEQRRTTAAARG